MLERWTAILPFKATEDSKTRLTLGSSQRSRLAREWLQRAVDSCHACDRIERTLVLTTQPLDWPGVELLVQAGNGLNAGLEEARQWVQSPRLLFLLPDLPNLSSDDLCQLLATCPDPGVALAPDRHGQGTNALALQCWPDLQLAFGPNSFEKHRLQVPSDRLKVVYVPGLAQDVDTLQDLEALPCPNP
jgi:2-phospho-L-lactate/phosphoenolpyruvate guanylyltransferase